MHLCLFPLPCLPPYSPDRPSCLLLLLLCPQASFIAQGGDDAMLRTLREEGADAATLVATCTTLRSVTVADDDRPCLTSGAFKSAREICSKGAASALLAVLRRALEEGSAPLAAAGCSALRRVSVTDEICQGIADDGGVELLLALSEAHADNAAVTRTAMSVMRQLANSDANKVLPYPLVPLFAPACYNHRFTHICAWYLCPPRVTFGMQPVSQSLRTSYPGIIMRANRP